jgi:PHP family Zn ribbon phosphoesterase
MTSSKNNDIRERIVDLHIHSHHSRATSKHLNIEELYTWGKIKGINVMGTGDFTHPAWFEELFKKLEPAEPGLYKLKDEFAEKQDVHIPPSCKNNEIRFVLTVEISNIYTRGGIGRRLHNIVIVPDFETASAINAQLAQSADRLVFRGFSVAQDHVFWDATDQHLLDYILQTHLA